MTAESRMKLVILIAAFLALLVFVVPSCNQPPPNREPTVADRESIDSHGLHQLNDARLREMMRRMSAMRIENVSMEIEAAGDLHRDICEVHKVAAELENDARWIPIIFTERPMTDESRRVLLTLSERMREEAIELGGYAELGDARMIKVKMDELMATCNSCHASFRASTFAKIDWRPMPSVSDVR